MRHVDPADIACLHHPYLSPDAWHEVKLARPVEQGAQAALVCRFLCPLTHNCPVEASVETIAGGGWYDQHGDFIFANDDEMEINQAAAYIGVSVDKLRSMIRYLDIKPVKETRYLRFLAMTDVKRLAARYSPPHGTSKAFLLHGLRGETPCTMCQRVSLRQPSPVTV